MDDASTKSSDRDLVQAPVIVDLGKKSKKAIRKLKRGTGKLMDEVDDAIDQVRAHLSEADKSKQIIPVLVIYQRKRKGGGRKGLGLPAMPFNPLSMFR